MKKKIINKIMVKLINKYYYISFIIQYINNI